MDQKGEKWIEDFLHRADIKNEFIVFLTFKFGCVSYNVWILTLHWQVQSGVLSGPFG